MNGPSFFDNCRSLHRLNISLAETIRVSALRKSRIAGQARKIENPDTLPKEHVYIRTYHCQFQTVKVFEEVQKNRHDEICTLVMYALK